MKFICALYEYEKGIIKGALKGCWPVLFTDNFQHKIELIIVFWMYLVAKKLNDPCEEAAQCAEIFGPNTECSKQMCSCKPEHYSVPLSTKCIAIKGKELLFTIRGRRRICLDCSRRFFQVVYLAREEKTLGS